MARVPAASRGGRSRSCTSRRRRPPGSAGRDADADRVEGARQDVRPVAGLFIQARPIARGRGEPAGPVGDVLADGPAVRAAQVAGAADAVEEARPVQRVVREEVPARHRARVALGGGREAPVQPQRAQVAAGALHVQLAERGPHEGALARRRERGVRGAAGTGRRGRRRGARNEYERESERHGGPAKVHPPVPSTPHARALGAGAAPWTSVRPRFGDMGAGRPSGCLRRPSST